MRFRTFWGWLLIFGIAAWLIKSDVVTIPAGVQQTFRTGINKVATSLDSVIDSNWNFNQNKATKADQASGKATPVESVVKGKNLSKTYYYSFAPNTPENVQKVFQQAIKQYNQTGIVDLEPGPMHNWLNHVTLGIYQKAMPENQDRTIELGVGGPDVIEQQGVVSRIANHASAKLNIYYNRSISQSVALHELGHALGLDHSQSLTSIMYPIDRGQQGLSEEDLNGLRSIYGKQTDENE
ncbi:matrixin family metalloprotease [Pediococcus acidilactici]|uniref:matrixin family metalloprotease n=1 Tax=Pediococcus acidilactici TaxID=1254 RepID=UPI00237F920F|nr:matrixin family metalloprotease [Pediococcus acidilactici]WDV25770.1 matrixin family metalloprotease [Pediococcus acidilactici]WEE14835.1 matrixin family metalloprotease [Pediococcus acidilactici]